MALSAISPSVVSIQSGRLSWLIPLPMTTLLASITASAAPLSLMAMAISPALMRKPSFPSWLTCSRVYLPSFQMYIRFGVTLVSR